jgi:hypothetical protein
MTYKIKNNNAMYAYRIWNKVQKHFESSGQGGIYTQRRTVWFNRAGATNTLRNLPQRDECVIKKYELVEVEDDETDPT